MTAGDGLIQVWFAGVSPGVSFWSVEDEERVRTESSPSPHPFSDAENRLQEPHAPCFTNAMAAL